VNSPLVRERQSLAQRANANSSTEAAANMTLVLWSYKYYTTMDMVCIETDSMSATAQGVEPEQRM